MKINKILTGCLMAGLLIFSSCEKDYEPETIENYEMSGQWFVQTYFEGSAPEDVVLGYVEIVTSNTAAADGAQLLIDDKGNIWPFKVKANVSGFNFSATNALNLYEEEGQTLTINNGTIVQNGGRAIGTNTVVDSIYFEAIFSDDPDNTYIIAGHYKTGFEEDIP